MKTGIYIIYNNITKDFYIGSSSKNIFNRINDHKSLLKNNKHHSIYLQRAWNKYKEKNFEFKILEFVIPKKCIKREQYYLDKLNPRYNICKKADSRLGTKHSKKTIKKLSKIFKGRKLPKRNKNWSDKISKETGLKLRKKNNTGYPCIYKNKYNKFIVSLRVNRKINYIGCFNTLYKAVKEWKKSIIKFYGKDKLKQVLLIIRNS